MLYKNELTPKRGKSIDTRKIKDLPPMCILNVDSQSGKKNGSRYNEGEISVLKKWLSENEESILHAYNKGKKDNDKKKITDLVNIITPFKAQVREIRKDPYLKQFPHGTVHTFQGAESPIVLFSMVYSANDTPTFITNNHELMNVAASRAKDHFIVVGNKECLSRNLTDRACKLLFEKTKEIFNINDTTE